MSQTARQWLEHIRALELPEKVRIMNFCGDHERACLIWWAGGVREPRAPVVA